MAVCQAAQIYPVPKDSPGNSANAANDDERDYVLTEKRQW